jgi:hypothetical protein
MPDRSQPSEAIPPKSSGYRYFAVVLTLAAATLAAMWLLK